jgi:hypothetical protein
VVVESWCVYDAPVRKHIAGILAAGVMLAIVVFLGARETIDEIAVENATSATVLVAEYPCEMTTEAHAETLSRAVRGRRLLADVPRMTAGSRADFPAQYGGTPLGKCLMVALEPGANWLGAQVRDGYLHRISETDAGLRVDATSHIGQRKRFDADKLLPLAVMLGFGLGGGYILSLVLGFWSGEMGKENFRA